MTSKPISTISYNSKKHLDLVLDKLLKTHIIQNYMYIFHKGEDGDKDHFHLYIEPNRRVDPMDIKDMFIERDHNNIKPLGVRPFRPSKEEDWILYAVHDSQYLTIKYGKGEKGEKLPYKWQDIISPQDFDIEIAFIRAKSKLEHTSSNLAKSLAEGESPLNLILQGENVHTVNALCQALKNNDYKRLQEELSNCTAELLNTRNAIREKGLSIEFDESGKMILI